MVHLGSTAGYKMTNHIRLHGAGFFSPVKPACQPGLRNHTGGLNVTLGFHIVLGGAIIGSQGGRELIEERCREVID